MAGILPYWAVKIISLPCGVGVRARVYVRGGVGGSDLNMTAMKHVSCFAFKRMSLFSQCGQ